MDEPKNRYYVIHIERNGQYAEDGCHLALTAIDEGCEPAMFALAQEHDVMIFYGQQISIKTSHEIIKS
jgi:hypothetical protein